MTGTADREGIDMTEPSHDILDLRPRIVPAEVTRVAGCTCGGLDSHRSAAPWSDHPGCAIWDLPAEQAQAAIDAAKDRLQAHTDDLNRCLHEALRGLRP